MSEPLRVITELGGLTCRVLQEQTDAPPQAVAVLCHGFGAPGDDLVGIYPELLQQKPALARTRFVFPQGLLSLEGAGYPRGARAWWQIDWGQIEQLSRGDPEALKTFRKVEPPGMPAARAAVSAMVQAVMGQTGLPYSKLVLGGFSQGSMITTDVALRLEEAPAGLVTLSGTLLIEDTWKVLAAKRAGLPVFQSHGRQDPVLRFDAAEALRDLYQGAGLKTHWLPFDGGHGMNLAVIEQLADFLAGLSG